MRRALAVVGLLGGCYAPDVAPGAPCPGGVCPTGLVCIDPSIPGKVLPATCELPIDIDAAPPPPDVPPDGATDMCFGRGLLSVCLVTLPTAPLNYSTLATIDTDTDAACVPATPTGLCVIAGTEVAVSGAVLAHGTRPLVLVALDVANLSGDIVTFANAAPMQCLAGTTPSGSEGGPGGSFAGRGGAGGSGVSAADAFVPSTLRGGCNGAPGAGAAAGAPGGGGGAIYIIAGSAIFVKGSIDASGTHGSGATAGGTSGGGGGGAGGMIGLDAPAVMLGSVAQIYANGAGGGEGNTALSDGKDGADPAAPLVRAAGGKGGSTAGGDGGDGAASTITSGGDGAGTSGLGGGGGGGGGIGFIGIYGALDANAGAQVSPQPHQ